MWSQLPLPPGPPSPTPYRCVGRWAETVLPNFYPPEILIFHDVFGVFLPVYPLPTLPKRAGQSRKLWARFQPCPISRSRL